MYIGWRVIEIVIKKALFMSEKALPCFVLVFVASITHDIFISAKKANSLLMFSAGLNAESGIYCECCVNRCTVTELEQYCNPLAAIQPRLRRSLHSTKSKQAKHFSQSDLNSLYKTVDVSKNDDERKVSLAEINKLKMLNIWKLENIENRLLNTYLEEATRNSSFIKTPATTTFKVPYKTNKESLNTRKEKLRHGHKHLHRKNKKHSRN